MNYDYLEAVKADLKDNFADFARYTDSDNFADSETLAEAMHSYFWVCDSVTGNASGSYTVSTHKAEEYLCHNYDLAREACAEFGCELPEYAEELDVTIRCYLLHQAIEEVLEEHFDEWCEQYAPEYHEEEI